MIAESETSRLKLVMTLMVRDEVDVIRAMLEHHIAQGVDHFIVTDNGSADGTTKVLEEYASRGILDLRHDPVHRKQQSQTVTQMAREAHTLYGADWVLNADADEFWVPVDRSLTLKSAFARIPKSLAAFPVPVVDMTGAPAMSGAGFQRLIYRDTRTLSDLARLGLHAHSTPNVAHVGSPNVTVAQGNHFVNIDSHGTPGPELAIEVLHLPWRSWKQFSRKVENAGRAYDSNPDLTPSPNHHGMRDWRRLQDGTLFGWYVARHPLTPERGTDHLRRDDTLASLFSGTPDEEIPDSAIRASRPLVGNVVSLAEELTESLLKQSELRDWIAHLDARIIEETSAHSAAEERAEALARELAALQDTFAVRTAVRFAPVLRRLRLR